MTRPEWSRVELDDLRAPEPHSLVGGPFGSDLTQKDYVPAPGVPVLRGINLGGNDSRFVDEGFVFVSEEKARSLSRNTAFRGDIVFTQRGTLGQVVVIPDDSRFERYVISQSQMKLTPDRQRVCPRFLYHYFRSPAVLTRLLGETLATGVPHINLGILKRFPVALPPLSEQQRIAAILDQADALRARRRASMEKLDVLTQSAFLDLFGDPIENPRSWPTDRHLADVAEIVSGITKGRKISGESTRPVPYLAVANVQDRALNLVSIKSIEATEKEIERLRLKFGDIVLTEGGDPDKLGRGTIWRGELRECIHQNHIFRVRITVDNIDPLFLSWLISSSRGKSYFLKSAKQTTGIASINMTQLRGFPLLVPPLDLQREFARRVQAIDALKAAQRRSLAKLDALFASLQHRAFRGEL